MPRRMKAGREEETCHYCQRRALLSTAHWKRLFDAGQPYICGACWKHRKYLARLAATGLFDVTINEEVPPR